MIRLLTFIHGDDLVRVEGIVQLWHCIVELLRSEPTENQEPL